MRPAARGVRRKERMMNQQVQEKDRFSPDKLLDGFRKTAFVKWLVVAVVAHAAVIVLTSLGYVLDLANPDRVKRREAEKQAQKAAEQAAQQPQEETAEPEEEPTAAAKAPDSDAALLEKYKDTPVVKAITEVAKPEEIPDKPQNIGISFEDTNIR